MLLTLLVREDVVGFLLRFLYCLSRGLLFSYVLDNHEKLFVVGSYKPLAMAGGRLLSMKKHRNQPLITHLQPSALFQQEVGKRSRKTPTTISTIPTSSSSRWDFVEKPRFVVSSKTTLWLSWQLRV